jgi:hypothetical protein
MEDAEADEALSSAAEGAALADSAAHAGASRCVRSAGARVAPGRLDVLFAVACGGGRREEQHGEEGEDDRVHVGLLSRR